MARKRTAKGPTAAELADAERVAEVLAIRLDGAQVHDVVRYAAEKGWGLTEAAAAELVARADALLVKRLDRSRARALARHVAQRESLYARAVNAGDYRTALAALQDLAKLQAVYPDRQLEEARLLIKEQGAVIAELEAANARLTRRDDAKGPPAIGPAEGEAVGGGGPGPGDGGREG